MCAKCQQLETDVQRYRDLLAQGRDALSLEVQRCRKLGALGFDPLTIGLINAAIEKLLSPRRRHAVGRHLARLVH